VIEVERLTTKQAGEILGISRRRVIALIEQKKLKAEKFGSVYSIARNDLETARMRKNGRPSKPGADIKPFKTIFDLAPEFVGFIKDDDLPKDLSSNKKYLEGLGTKEAEKAALKNRQKRKR
jgi:excisionase family DNA binding protein